MGKTNTIDATLSFASGRGSIEHNKRQKNGNPRTYGIRERRDWNVTWNERDVYSVIAAKVAPPLGKYNARMIAQKRYKRTMTTEEWIAKHTRNGKDNPYCEYVIQLGNKLTACTYRHKRDNEGYPVDRNGERIYPWQTRKNPEPLLENGKVVESEMSKFLKPVYYDIMAEFERENPGMIVVGAYVHADESGGIHMHLDCICFSATKNGVGIGLSKTGCIAEILTKKGIKFGKTRRDNALKVWTARMREMCTRVVAKHGINIVDGHCAGRQHKSTDDYINDENIRNDYLDKMFAGLQRKEKEIQAMARRLNKRQDLLAEKEAELKGREAEIKQQENDLKKRIDDVQKAANAVEYHGSVVQSQKLANERREKWLDDREQDVEKKEQKVANRLNALERMENDIRMNKIIADTVRKEYPHILSEITIERGKGNGKQR